MTTDSSEAKPYEEYEGNEFVESMGGRDLMAPKDDENIEGGFDYAATPTPLEVASIDEQRRVASLQTAQSLGTTNVVDLLSAAKLIENYLKGENPPA